MVLKLATPLNMIFFVVVLNILFFGGMLALNIRGMSLNVSSAVGFIALFGVAIQNGVIMISHINDLRKKGHELKESVIKGARDRFRPVFICFFFDSTLRDLLNGADVMSKIVVILDIWLLLWCFIGLQILLFPKTAFSHVVNCR